MSPTPKRQPGWICPDCESLNESTNARCRNCQTGTPPTPQAAITRYEFNLTGQQVRTVLIGGEPWFIATDVCAVLEIAHAASSLRLLDDDEKGVHSVHTPGGVQRVAVVNEPGLYSLILRSRKPQARAFKRWITHEVLPTIRRTGSYGAAETYEIPRTLPEALRAYAAEVEAHEVTRAALEEAAPAADAWNVLASADPDYSVREAAYILNRDPAIDTGQNRLFNEMRRLRVIDSRDIPYSGHARHVKLRPRSFTNRATGEETPAKPQVRVTAEGLAYLHRKLGGTAPLRLDEQTAIGGA